MTPGARVQACIELLTQIAAEAQDSSTVLDAYFRARRYAGSGDRRAVTQRVYENLRHRARIGGSNAQACRWKKRHAPGPWRSWRSMSGLRRTKWPGCFPEPGIARRR